MLGAHKSPLETLLPPGPQVFQQVPPFSGQGTACWVGHVPADLIGAKDVSQGKSWQCLMGETGPPAMSGQGSKVEQRTLKIPPSTGFEGNPENTLSRHQVPLRNVSGFPGSSNSKEFPCKAKTQVLSLDREDPLERAAWWATVHGVAEGQTRLHN